MPKILCIIGTVIAALVFLVFASDLAIGIPFRQASKTMDIGFLVFSIVLGYLSWTTLREQD